MCGMLEIERGCRRLHFLGQCFDHGFLFRLGHLLCFLIVLCRIVAGSDLDDGADLLLDRLRNNADA